MRRGFSDTSDTGDWGLPSTGGHGRSLYRTDRRITFPRETNGDRKTESPGTLCPEGPAQVSGGPFLSS